MFKVDRVQTKIHESCLTFSELILPLAQVVIIIIDKRIHIAIQTEGYYASMFDVPFIVCMFMNKLRAC